MIKLVFFVSNYDVPYFNILNNIASDVLLENKKIKIFFYGPEPKKKITVNNRKIKLIFSKSLEYLIKNNDSRYYDEFINFCIKNKIDYAYIYKLLNIEFLYNELKYKEGLETRFIFMSFGFELLRSKIQKIIYSKLVAHRLSRKVIFATILGNNFKFDKKFRNLFKKESIKKIIKINEYRLGNLKKISQLNARKFLKIKKNKKIILFFGRPFYGKGIDIFIKSTKNVGKNYTFLVASNLKLINFEIKNLRSLKMNKNIIFYNKDISERTKSILFNACDAVCLPYRKSYENCTSSVLVEALMFKKSVIVPNFYPFSSFIKQYKVGSVFKAENYLSLRKSIKNFFNLPINHKNFKKNLEKYKKNSEDWKSIPSIIANEIKND